MWFSVVGLSLDVAGVLLLMINEWLSRNTQLAWEELPDDHFANKFEQARSAPDGESSVAHLIEPSPESIALRRAEKRDSAKKARTRWMIAGVLLITGFVLQIVGAFY
ncbi:MAG: hypothetical protein WBD31_14890 [Rubripirellula sp.]